MTQPNILLIMTDQQRFDTLGAAGNPAIQTPQLDRLCREGVRFAAGYTESPVCVPARATVMTGWLPHRHRVFDNGYRLDPTTPTLMGRLRSAGYVTQAIGKMHFTPKREGYGFSRLWLSEAVPSRIEDDEFLADLHAAGHDYVEEPHGVRHELYYIPQVSQLPEHLHTTAWTARRTVQFLEEQRDSSAPFFCWTSFIKPHPPFDPPVPWHRAYLPTDMPLPVRDQAELAWHTYYHRWQNRIKWMDTFPDDNLLRTMKAYYYASISFIDSQVGLILDALERLSLRENTLILFISDHGEYLGDHSITMPSASVATMSRPRTFHSSSPGRPGYHPTPSVPNSSAWPTSRRPASRPRSSTPLGWMVLTCSQRLEIQGDRRGSTCSGSSANRRMDSIWRWMRPGSISTARPMGERSSSAMTPNPSCGTMRATRRASRSCRRCGMPW